MAEDSSGTVRTFGDNVAHNIIVALLALCWGALVVLPIALPAQSADDTRGIATGTELPVRAVMLFSSGVAFFDHRGAVRDSGFAELRFRTRELNDVLKSLTLRDNGAGSFTAVTLPSHDPLERQLSSYQVNLSGNPSLPDLLNQLRGASVTIRSGGEQLRGSVIGVHRRVTADSSDRTADGGGDVINIFNGSAIRSVRVNTIESLALDDPGLREELQLALAAISRARDAEYAPVRLHFSGRGEREVGVGYLTEAPVWKASYRLVLGDTTALLQGWAIVENQTGADWRNVALSLVSGQPVSFAMDLHAPQYQERALVPGFRQAVLSPVVYGAGVAANRPTEALRVESTGTGTSADPRGLYLSGVVTTGTTNPTSGERAAFRVAPAAGSIQLRVPSLATQGIDAAMLGDLFEYRIPSVSVPRQQSAMIPIVNGAIPIERVSIFTAGVAPGLRNPLNGVVFRNTTGSHLLHGPVTVLDGESYAGDSRIANIPDTARRLISYGVDLEMTVDATVSSVPPVLHRISVTRGIVQLELRGPVRTTYSVDSRRNESRMVVLEHVRRPNATLSDSTGFFESTPSVHRFRGTAEPHRSSTFTVEESVTYPQSISLIAQPIASIRDRILVDGVPDEVRAGVERIITLRQSIAMLEAGIAERDKMTAEITKEQERIRENMKTVGSATGYYDRLLVKLNEQESDLERLGRARREMASELAAVQASLAEFAANFTVAARS